MTVETLTATDFRCLANAHLALHPQTNLIAGPNASGKTSLLEALFFLGRGRSFRSVRTRGLIRDGAASLAISAGLSGHPKRLGIGAGADGLTIRIDGQPAKGVASLVRSLPVQVVEPGIHRLVEAGPAERRAFLDWGVFHVKQSFLEEWRRYQRALKQRNAAIRAGEGRAGARAWEDALINAGEAVHGLRARYVQQLETWLKPVGEALLRQGVEGRYHKGWGDGLGLAEALDSSWERDQRVGITHVGPHRADLQLRTADRMARSRVSRGQQKLLAAGLVLAQMHLFAQERDEHAVLLLDDPAAELDRFSLERLYDAVAEVPAQRLITGLDPTGLPTNVDHAMFHVEQGKIQKVV